MNLSPTPPPHHLLFLGYSLIILYIVLPFSLIKVPLIRLLTTILHPNWPYLIGHLKTLLPVAQGLTNHRKTLLIIGLALLTIITNHSKTILLIALAFTSHPKTLQPVALALLTIAISHFKTLQPVALALLTIVTSHHILLLTIIHIIPLLNPIKRPLIIHPHLLLRAITLYSTNDQLHPLLNTTMPRYTHAHHAHD